MAERQDFARYHYQEVLRLLDDFQKRHLADRPLFVVSHGTDEEARGDFELLMTQISAHALACVLSIHAVADVTAFAAYHALGYGLQPDPLRERDISANSVQARLLATPDHAGIATLIGELCIDANYKHVAALANKSKHQALVRPVLNEDWTGNREQRHEIRFSAFKIGENEYPEVALATLLMPAYNLASRITIDVGNALNTHL